VLDVAHNPQSVAALALNLDQMGFFPRTFAVFGAMHDKDLTGIVAKLGHLVDDWLVTDLPIARAAPGRRARGPASAPRPRRAPAGPRRVSACTSRPPTRWPPPSPRRPG
jgi:dihydrofolate synthase/folylpolyglutamate synthase